MPDADQVRHAWDVTPLEARQIQAELAPRVVRDVPLGSVRLVAGADISYDRGDDTLYAAVVVVDLATLEPLETASLAMRVAFPYVPGLLSFREAPPILAAFERLTHRPDVLITDGQGLAHPRRFGVACHLGLILDIPAVGCGKSRLIGTFPEPGIERGSRSPLMDKGETIGAVVRSRRGVKPLFVSVGHRANLDSAVDLVLALTPKYRVPVPTRLAHVAVNQLRTAAHPEGSSAPPPGDDEGAES